VRSSYLLIAYADYAHLRRHSLRIVLEYTVGFSRTGTKMVKAYSFEFPEAVGMSASHRKTVPGVNFEARAFEQTDR
jgi:hypothetical protein